MRHAPRERVSWNLNNKHTQITYTSRSTWACELKCFWRSKPSYMLVSRSTWACELKLRYAVELWSKPLVTLHVSVWVEMKHTSAYILTIPVTLHVSVWVEMCASRKHPPKPIVTLHVSVWVEMSSVLTVLTVKSVTLHVSVWVEMIVIVSVVSFLYVTLHVSVWVEIFSRMPSILRPGHAPRERVSWNVDTCSAFLALGVTLHVSVWVEIYYSYCA